MDTVTQRIKKTMVCKDIQQFHLNREIVHTHTPGMGDVGIFEILEIGKHVTIQTPSKRNSFLLEGDYIMAAFANRYATGQYEGYVPDQPTEFLDILGAGGAVGIVKSKNAALEHIEPTRIRLVGYATAADGQVLNTIYHKVKRETFRGEVPNGATVILSVGSTMDSGKTTSAAFLVKGLKTTGKKVAYIKLTGTCFSKDQDFVYDCGADKTVDFSDAGYPSTYLCTKQELLDLYQSLMGLLAPINPDYIVMEIADGIVQLETNFLLKDAAFMATIDHVMFSAGDSLAAFFGETYLKGIGLAVTAFSGRFTMSPLLIQEVQADSKVPVFTIDELAEAAIVPLMQKKAAVRA